MWRGLRVAQQHVAACVRRSRRGVRPAGGAPAGGSGSAGALSAKQRSAGGGVAHSGGFDNVTIHECLN